MSGNFRIEQLRDGLQRVVKRAPEGVDWPHLEYVRLCLDCDPVEGYEGMAVSIGGVLENQFIVLDKAEGRLVAEQLLNYADGSEGA